MDDSAAMLRDIDSEVALTRRQIGKDALDARVMAAMATVPRQEFVPDISRFLAFTNGPLSIGYGQTISQPYIVALMTDLLAPRPDATVLEIGTGSGYQAAVLAQLAAKVYSIEIVAALATQAAERLVRLGCANVEVMHADGYYGWAEHAPYDGIMVRAAAPAVPPPLIGQLKPGARLVIPVGLPGSVQRLEVIDKNADGSCSHREILTVSFVPLTRNLPPH